MSEKHRLKEHRLGFRFLVIYAVLYVAPFPIDRLPGPFIQIASSYAHSMYALESWVAKHLLGVAAPLGFIPHPNGGGDSPADFVRLLCIAITAALGTVAWALAAPRREPAWIQSFLKTYLRYFLATMMLLYGLGKITPDGQFYFPRLDYLLRPLGDLAPADLLAAFMGSSYAYTLFAGLGETIGGLLLLWRRSAPLGGLILIPILLNVLMMNVAYGWDVKVGAAHYLLIALFLSTPLLQRLVRLVFADQPALPVPVAPPILGSWPRGRIGLKVVFVAWMGWLAAEQTWLLPAQWGDDKKTTFFGIWDVEAMERGGSPIPATLTESRRWRQVVFERNQRVIVRMMSDSLRSFRANIDPSAATITLAQRRDTSVIGSFAFAHDPDGRLVLSGILDSFPARVTLKPVHRTFRLGSCPIRLIADGFC